MAVTRTDSLGHYRFAGLLPGRRYAVTAFKEGYWPSALAPGEPVLTPLWMAEAGRTIRQDRVLEPAAR